MTKEKLSVSAIKEGSVIDHIPCGEALTLIQILNLSKKRLNIGTHLPSKRLGYKDLLKVHDVALSEADVKHLVIFAPQATINVIEDFKVIKKLNAHLPEEIQGTLVCPNSSCITRFEKTLTHFYVKSHKCKVYLQCRFCQKDFLKEEVKKSSL